MLMGEKQVQKAGTKTCLKEDGNPNVLAPLEVSNRQKFAAIRIATPKSVRIAVMCLCYFSHFRFSFKSLAFLFASDSVRWQVVIRIARNETSKLAPLGATDMDLKITCPSRSALPRCDPNWVPSLHTRTISLSRGCQQIRLCDWPSCA